MPATFIRITSEEVNKKVQEELFKLGFQWSSRDSNYCAKGADDYGYPFVIYVDEVNKLLTYSSMEWRALEYPDAIERDLSYYTGVKTTWTDRHYGFEVDVSKIDTLKVDPYFVSYTWKLGEKDNSGALFHILKTIARFGSKNEREREIKAIYAQIKRLAELEGVTL